MLAKVVKPMKLAAVITSLPAPKQQTTFSKLLYPTSSHGPDWNTVQKMKLSIKDLFSKYDQIQRKLCIWTYLLKKSLMGNFIFCEVSLV